jgi:hypothetical protein
MDKKEIKKIITEQIIGMWENNILHENGYESIVGWLEDGDALINDGYTLEETNEIMEVVKRIQDRVDDLSWILAPEKED